MGNKAGSPSHARPRAKPLEVTHPEDVPAKQVHHLLDPETLKIISTTWEVIKNRGELERVGATHFKLFLSQCGEAARKLFIGTDIKKQQHVITPVVEYMIQNPDEAALHALAVYHAHLGVTTSELRTFCNCFVDAIVDTLGAAATPPVRESWRHAMGTLTEALGIELDQCNKVIREIGDDRDHNHNGKLAAHRMMRLRTSRTQNLPLATPDKAGWLRISMYGAHHIKPPKTNADHVLDAFKARWTELRGQFLYYKVHEMDRPDGVIDLSACELIDTSSVSKLPSPTAFSFALRNHMTPKFPWYFVCQGDDDKEEWFAALRRACNRFSFIRSDLYVGQRVRVCGEDNMVGLCKWTGKHEEKDGLYIGIECDREVPEGHAGEEGGVRYFTCPAGRGVLLPAYQVAALSPLEIQVQGDSLPTNTYTPAQFEFIKVIGKGSFGRVCKVRENATGKIFAVKILQKAALVRESQITNIRREKSILLNIKHPFIVKLHAAFQTRGRLFLLFDFLTGGELFHHVQSCPGGHLKEDEARFYYAEVALAIAHLHENNIIHRDLKAENLVLDKDGHCVLTDFGFAKTVLAHEHNTTRCGTLPYMAPEILKQSPMGYGFEVDWWASGVLLFLLLTGCYPFWDSDPRETMKQIVNRKIKLNTFPMRPKLSEEARSLVLRLIEKDPTQRLSNVEDVKRQSWFAGFDWDACNDRRMTPPFVPDQKGANTKYFEPDNSGAGQSKPLPKGWSRDAAFASFFDIHEDYKKPSEVDSRFTSGGEDNERFIENMNRWSMSEADRTQTLSPQLLNADPLYDHSHDTFTLMS
eukprot:TRINITY_DN9223_c0_g1_i1.p1 TRINITY_DN9223_c0_g1~~TRINITY_DN9223_c0_g1_i1.p1  ORF type:complete len:810 (+),score=241.63 TRINITY_DN9223_c0_g1_i1:396-2825(+)